jgi:hypothetical protein
LEQADFTAASEYVRCHFAGDADRAVEALDTIADERVRLALSVYRDVRDMIRDSKILNRQGSPSKPTGRPASRRRKTT